MDNSRATTQGDRSDPIVIQYAVATGGEFYETPQSHIEEYADRAHDDVLSRLRGDAQREV